MAAVRPRTALAILAALNFFNFADRSILFQVQPLVQREFGVSRLQIGLLTTAFLASFSVAAPLLGMLADRVRRRPIIVGGAVFWSLATLLTAVASTFPGLLFRHALVGIGEGCMVAAPGYVADLFPRTTRARSLSVYFMAAPVGTAAGYAIAAVSAGLYGWRAPFYALAAPGLATALLLLLGGEPTRGAQDEAGAAPAGVRLRDLAGNRAFLHVTAGMCMVSFAVGGAQAWMPDFLTSFRGMTIVASGHFLGAAILVNGLVATWIAGWLADRLRSRLRNPEYLLATLAVLLALPLTLAGLFLSPPAMLPAIFVAVFFLIFNVVPMATAALQSVAPGVRSTAIAFYALSQQLAGAATAPPVIGYLADGTGSLQTGLLAVVAALVVAAPLFYLGRRHAPASAATSIAEPPASY